MSSSSPSSSSPPSSSNGGFSSPFLRRLHAELSGRKLAFNFLFHGLHLFLFAYGWWSQQSNEKLAVLNGLKFSVWTSRGAGLVLAFDGGLILVPSTSSPSVSTVLRRGC